MSGFDVIKKTIDDHTDLMGFLVERKEISYLTAVEASLPKVILLASASDLEVRTQDLIIDFFARRTQAHEFAVNFVKNKAVKRQFHTYFDWTARSANPFFGLFGSNFKAKAQQACSVDSRLKSAVRDFCEIGALRNELVHTNYATYVLQKTATEVFQMYQEALYFIEKMESMLEGFAQTQAE